MNKVIILDRLGRPLLRMAGVFMLLTIGTAIAFAYWHSAMTGVPVPDMTGGMAPIATLIIPQGIDLITRHLQRTQELQFGQVPGTAMANPHGGPGAP